MKPADFRFQEALRVRWVEVDLQKIVFNGHYLMYLDTAMAGYWRALALPYEDSMAHLAGDLFVRKATLEYHAPAQYDDQLQIGLRCDRVGSSSITFGSRGVPRWPVCWSAASWSMCLPTRWHGGRSRCRRACAS